jgi:hypothetical protein
MLKLKPHPVASQGNGWLWLFCCLRPFAKVNAACTRPIAIGGLLRIDGYSLGTCSFACRVEWCCSWRCRETHKLDRSSRSSYAPIPQNLGLRRRCLVFSSLYVNPLPNKFRLCNRSGGYERMRVSGLQIACLGLVEPDFCRFGVSVTAEIH